MENSKKLLYVLLAAVVVLILVGVILLLTIKPGNAPASGDLSSVTADVSASADPSSADPGESSPASQPEESSEPESSEPSSQASSAAVSSSQPASSAASSSQTPSQTVTQVDAPAPSQPAPVSSAAEAPAGYTAMPEGGYSKEELAADLDKWNLFLLNPDHSVSEDFGPPERTSVGNDQSIDSRIYTAYRALIAAAKADGVDLWVLSGYRSYSKQNRLYTNRVARAKNDNPSFTQAEAEAYAARIVAVPGTSEHQSGLAIDFNSVEQNFANTKAGKWLKANAAHYGFILRYEENKQDITKIIYEPWHYRYVGAKHALTMQEKGMCLEEYLDWLQGN